MTENTEILDDLIVGRVRPRIYAFSTGTVPDFLKVGDTYRTVSTRIQEWRTHYPQLEKHFEGSASISNDVYFRDHAVHNFLIHTLGRRRLTSEEFAEGVYQSNEFFEGASSVDVSSAIEDVLRDHAESSGRYRFFDAADRLPAVHHFQRGDAWEPRPNQQAAIDRFAEATAAGRTNLLMYAVMRFGKTFTSLMCAKQMKAKTVLVVSAKADVKGEWKQTVESAGNFDGFIFLDADDLLGDANTIRDARAAEKSVVLFLTLQDLQGSRLKEKHEEVFKNEVDLLLIDETHFGARGEKYGEVLRAAKQPIDSAAGLSRNDDDKVDVADAETQLKVLRAKVRLHLSGSPYRILMGSEFTPDDIIAFVQFADIVREQEAWNAAHPDENEWENPYFGFPQMVRFAFNPNQSSRDKLAELRQNGATYAFSALFEPLSIALDAKTKLHQEFKHKPEILGLLRAIDGSQEDPNLLGFLDYDRIKQGEMCRHLVMVLPYRASCDAMKALIERHASDFKNLGDYEIINISGVEGAKLYPDPATVKAAIARAHAEGRKTLTLTVNRMLTGSTVEQWDTMLYLKDTASPQEYDQAIFRLQSPHTRVLTSIQDSDTDGAEEAAEEKPETIKENLKPQTLLVDFDPMRMFRMQELRSLMSNVNNAESGNSKLEDRLREDLRISPIVEINHDRMREVEAANILQAVSEYNLKRSIADEARDVPVDMGLLNVQAIRLVIERQAELGHRAGLSIDAVDGEGADLDVDLDDEQPPPGNDTDEDPTGKTTKTRTSEDDLRSLERKLQTYYQRILFFAMLSTEPLRSLQDIVELIENGKDARIAENLSLESPLLRAMVKAFDAFKLSALDYKIQNISRLSREEALSPTDRANRALEKFTRISDSEVRTPLWLCREIVGRIPADRLKGLVERGEKVLDLASKSGEFAIAFYERLVDELDLDPALARSAIYSVPTSGIAYEFTRRFYDILGLDVANIAVGFATYDLLHLSSEDVTSGPAGEPRWVTGLFHPRHEGSAVLKFGAIVGNPPFQESDGGAQSSARSIYPQVIAAAAAMNPRYLSFVIPSRWYAGGKHLGDFRTTMLADRHIRELHDFPNPETVFPGTNNRGGVCYFLRDTDYDAVAAGGTRILTRSAQDVEFDAVRPLDTFDMGEFLRDSKGLEIVRKVIQAPEFVSFQEQVSPRKPFALGGTIVRTADFHGSADGLQDPIKCYVKNKQVGYVERSIVRVHREWLDAWKVLTPRANNIGTELNDDNQNAFVVAPGSTCSETYLVMGADLGLSEVSARNLVVYLKSRLARFFHGKAKVSHDATRTTYRFVPQVDVSPDGAIDWEASAECVDEQLFDLFSLTVEERDHIRASVKQR